jgi:hypothetical protein
MNLEVDPPTNPDPGAEGVQVRSDRKRKWRMFGVGLAVRLFGLALIWLGDGGSSVFRKALVVAGVILSIGGITVLRFLLISGFRRHRGMVNSHPASGIEPQPLQTPLGTHEAPQSSPGSRRLKERRL